jgi:hypothetical protein
MQRRRLDLQSRQESAYEARRRSYEDSGTQLRVVELCEKEQQNLLEEKNSLIEKSRHNREAR